MANHIKAQQDAFLSGAGYVECPVCQRALVADMELELIVHVEEPTMGIGVTWRGLRHQAIEDESGTRFQNLKWFFWIVRNPRAVVRLGRVRPRG